MPDPLPFIQTHTIQQFDAPNAIRLVARKMRDKTDLAMLYQDAASQSFQPLTGPKDAYAFKETYKAAQPIKDPQTGEEVQELEVDFSVQNLKSAQSKDLWAIASVTLTSIKPDHKPGPSEEYHMRLVAPLGNLAKSTEFIVVGGKVTQTHSWWSRMKKCLKNKCVAECAKSLATCPKPSWVAYLACVAARCGGCWVKCAACAGCKCKWWCKWGVGCCKA